jgi:peptide/nickel transport system permease protein
VRYVLRRLLYAIPTLLAISILNFGIIHLAPGGPTAVYASSPNVSPQQLAAIETRLGLHDPLPVQYLRWLRGMVVGDWGTSYKYVLPASQVVLERSWNTLQLMIVTIIIALLLSIPFGVLSAASNRRGVQYASSVASMLGISVPTFWLGIMILLVFSVRVRIIPSGGMGTLGQGFNPLDWFRHVIAPACVLATLRIAGWSRYVRSSMLEVMGQDYVRTARGKGLREVAVLYKHELRNALIPLITLIGLEGGQLLGGAMITEVVFSWPGVGQLLDQSLTGRDYPVLMGAFMMMAVMVVLGNLLADVGYAFADPRVRLE